MDAGKGGDNALEVGAVEEGGGGGFDSLGQEGEDPGRLFGVITS